MTGGQCSSNGNAELWLYCSWYRHHSPQTRPPALSLVIKDEIWTVQEQTQANSPEMLDSFHENTIEAWGVSVYGRQMSIYPIFLHKIPCSFHMACNRAVDLHISSPKAIMSLPFKKMPGIIIYHLLFIKLLLHHNPLLLVLNNTSVCMLSNNIIRKKYNGS